ncbi:cysteine desulfurase, partial [Aureobasidium melanogenum]
MNPPNLDTINTVLRPSELIDPSTDQYKSESQTWQAHRNLHPKVLARPRSVETLAALIACLAASDLDWAVRCQGIGDASARDVLVSLMAFNDFAFDAQSECIVIGAGMTWGEVEKKLEEEAPGYQALSARCSFVGVSGMILHGGLSWISSTYGLASDPQNFLDAQVIKLDGSIIWASEEPDLLLALRGGGHEVAIVTAFKLKVYKYSQNIYSGSIKFPRSALREVAKGVEGFGRRMEEWPGAAMYLYNTDLMEGSFIGAAAQPGIAIWLFDPEGEEHGRKIFDWAFEIHGAVDETKIMNLRQINIHGVFRSADGNDQYAWPHTTNQHLLQLGAGRLDEGDYPTQLDRDALDMLKNAGKLIVGDEFSPADHFVNFLQPWNDRRAIFGENYDKLQAVKKKYDPRGVLIRNYE